MSKAPVDGRDGYTILRLPSASTPNPPLPASNPSLTAPPGEEGNIIPNKNGEDSSDVEAQAEDDIEMQDSENIAVEKPIPGGGVAAATASETARKNNKRKKKESGKHFQCDSPLFILWEYEGCADAR